MYTRSLFRILRRIVVVSLCTLLLLMSLTSCIDQEAQARIRTQCEAVLDALIAQDIPAAHAVLPHVSEEEFLAFTEQIAPLLEDVTSYELKQTGWHIQQENVITQITMTYRMVCDNGRVLLAQGIETTGIENLSGFYLSMPETAANNTAALPLRILFIVISFAATAFCVWMIVDCARRRMKRKALWILLILVNVIFTLTVGGGIDFNTTLGLILSRSSIYINSYTKAFQISLSLPIGAIIYAVLRRSLTLPDAPTAEEEQTFEPDAD